MDHRYTYVEQFKRFLFQESNTLFDMKNALFKLQSALKEPVAPDLFGDITYEKITLILEECALELGYSSPSLLA